MTYRTFSPLSRLCVCLFLCLAACSDTDRPHENFGPADSEREAGAGARDASARDAAVGEDAGDDAGSDAGDAGGSGVPAQGFAQAFEGCGSPPVLSGDFSKRRLRRSAVACTGYQLCGFRALALDLERAVAAHAEEPGDDAKRAAAQQAFRVAMALWSRVESMQFGPLASASISAGKDSYQGQGLRDRVYSWTLVSHCRVDEQLESREYQEDDVTLLVSERGLYALEYLLFETGSTPACEDAYTFSESELTRRRAEYAQVIAQDLVRLSETLEDAYALDGTYAESFIDGSGYPSEQEALNVLGWALIYVERELKDWKLGVPAGFTAMSMVPDPESPYAGISGNHLVHNLEGFSRLFEGCGEDHSGLGFDDWLVAAGHDDLAEDLEEAASAARSALEELPADLTRASREDVVAAYDAVRALTTLLKGDLFGAGSPLNLKLPASVEGDTD